jgi:hypothetical protein
MSTEHILSHNQSVDELEPTEMAPLSSSTGSDFVTRPSAASTGSSLIFTHNGDNIVIPARTALLMCVASIVVVLGLIVGMPYLYQTKSISSPASPAAAVIEKRVHEEIKKIEDQVALKKHRDTVFQPINLEIGKQRAFMDESEVDVLDEIQRNETLLFLTISAVPNQLTNRRRRRGEQVAQSKLFSLITDQNVYRFKYFDSELWWANVYKFNSPLSIKEIEMLKFISIPKEFFYVSSGSLAQAQFHQQLNALPVLGKSSIVQSIVSPTFAHAPPPNYQMVGSFTELRGMHLPNTVVSEARKKLESILELIPGSKKQEADWQALNGMFGDLWYNSKTKQLSDFPGIVPAKMHQSEKSQDGAQVSPPIVPTVVG